MVSLKRFVEFDGMSVTADNLTINGKYDEVAQKVIAAKVAEMRAAYERQAGKAPVTPQIGD